VVEHAVESQRGAGAIRSIARVAGWWRDSVGEPVLSVLFPPRCVGCRDFETYLCSSCRGTLVEIGPDACPRCGEPGPRPLVAGRCSHCMSSDLSYSGVRSAFQHQGAARSLVAEFKFGGQPVLGRLMSELAGPVFTQYLSSVGARDRVLVTWVPSHRAARRERGYNQAEVLARALASGSAPMRAADLVEKKTATRHQKELGKAGRQSNLRGAFVLKPAGAALSDPGFTEVEAIVLVDDVYTTGATAQEVSSVLVAGTGVPVYVFTFSRAVGRTVEGHD
jgi:predicted amidophosphoribosyltransferase